MAIRSPKSSVISGKRKPVSKPHAHQELWGSNSIRLRTGLGATAVAPDGRAAFERGICKPSTAVRGDGRGARCLFAGKPWLARITGFAILMFLPFSSVHADTTPPPMPPLSDGQRHQAEAEVKQGEEIAAAMEKTQKVLKDDPRAKHVEEIGQRLVPYVNASTIDALFGEKWIYPFKWHFSVVKDADINAFSIPGGYVYVNTGLLDRVRSDDELAGILGHEMTHVAHHHIAAISKEAGKMNMQLMVALLAAMLAHTNGNDTANVMNAASLVQQGLLNTKYSQNAERDADHGGCIFMQKAGFNPAGMLTFMELLQDQERRSPQIELGIFRDHPLTTERVAAIRAQITGMGVDLTPAILAKVSGVARVTVNLPTPETSEILIGKHTIATLSDPQGTRGHAAADILNRVLDHGLVMYQVKAENGALIAANTPIVTFTPADAALSHGLTTDAMADEASKALRNVLYTIGIGDSGAY